MTHPAPTASCTGSRTDVSVYEPLCPTCRLPLDKEERERLAEIRTPHPTRAAWLAACWECAACGLPAWGWDWDDDAEK